MPSKKNFKTNKIKTDIMKRFINVTKEVRQRLRVLFKVTDVMVWKALHFESDSLTARRIRKAALEMGGVEMATSPVMETIWDKDGYMRNFLPNGAVVELCDKDGTGCVIFKGKTVRTYENLMLVDIDGIQAFAARLR